MSKYLLIVFSCFIIFISCANENRSLDDYSLKVRDSAFLDRLDHFLEIRSLSKELAHYGIVEGSEVGSMGIRSRQYERYLHLKKVANDEELVSLVTDNESPVVKAYAFLALAERKSSHLRDIPKSSLSDTTSFKYCIGCFGRTEYLNEYYSDVASFFVCDNVGLAYNNSKPIFVFAKATFNR